MAAIFTNIVCTNSTGMRLMTYWSFVPNAPSVTSFTASNAQTQITLSSSIAAPTTGSFFINNMRGRRGSSNSYSRYNNCWVNMGFGSTVINQNVHFFLNTSNGAYWEWKDNAQNKYVTDNFNVGIVPSGNQAFWLQIHNTGGSTNNYIFNKTTDSGNPQLYLNLNTTTPTVEYSRDNSSWQSSNVFSSLTPNTTYTFYLRAKTTSSASGNESPYVYSSVQGKTTGNKPSNLTISATAHTYNTITVSFSATADSGTPITNYTIYYKRPTDSNYSSVSAGTSTSKQITGLVTDQDYTIYFTATNSVGTSTSSTISYSTLLSEVTIADHYFDNVTTTSIRQRVTATGYRTPLEYLFSSDGGTTWKRNNRNLFNFQRWANCGVAVKGGASATISGTSITFTSIDSDSYTNTYHMTSSSVTEVQKGIVGKYGFPVAPNTLYYFGYTPSNANVQTQAFVFWYDTNWNYLSHAAFSDAATSERRVASFTSPSNAVYACLRFDIDVSGQSQTFSNIYFGTNSTGDYVAFVDDSPYYTWTGLSPDTDYSFKVKAWSLSYGSYSHSMSDTSTTWTQSTYLPLPTVSDPIINRITPNSIKDSIAASITPSRTLNYYYGIWTNKNSEIDLRNGDPQSDVTVNSATKVTVVKNTSGQTWSSTYIDISDLLEDKTFYKISTGSFSITGGSTYWGAISVSAHRSPTSNRVIYKDATANKEICFYVDKSIFPFYRLTFYLTNDTAGTGSTTGVFNDLSFQALQYKDDDAFVYDGLKENTTYYLANGVIATHTGANAYDTFDYKVSNATTAIQSPIVKIKRNFPAGYTQLSYIQNSGTQYINSEIPGSNIGEIITKFNCTSIGNSWNSVCFSEYVIDDIWPGCGIRIQSGTTLRPQWGNKSVQIASFTINTDYEIDFNILKEKIKINGTNYNYNVPRGEYEPETYNMYIFANNSVGSATQLAPGLKLYYLKLYDFEGNLLRDYVPAERNSDNVVGLYDLVSNTFFTNAGTGTFTAGSIVESQSKWLRGIPKIKINGNWVDAKQCYIKNSGNWTKAKIDKYDNFCYWKYWKESDYSSRWNITYDNELELNRVSCVGSSGCEELYYPFATESGSTYRVTFDYFNPNGYTPLSGYTGISCQALRSLPTDSDERVNSNVINEILLSPLSNVQTQRLTFNFTAVGDVTYINYNYGLAADGITTTLWLGNFTIEKIS